MLLGPGQGNDSPMFRHVLDAIHVPRLGPGDLAAAPTASLADKAYSSRGNRAPAALQRNRRGHPRARRSDRSPQTTRLQGGRPVTYDPESYRGRNVVERSFNLFKHWRGLATRYDKLALTYRGGVVLASITIWLRQ